MGDEVKIKKDKKDKKEKKDKSDKKSKDSKKEKLVNADENRVHKSSSAEKTEKKKKDKLKKAAEGFLDGKMEKAERVVPVPSVNEGKMEVDEESAEESEVEKKAAADAGIEPVGSEDGEGRVLVPFAFPLANEKLTKKSLKCVKKAAKSKCLKRGVKEVVKALRKSGSGGAGIVILAADISPMDVISHLPILCEDHNIPYLFVTSRAELGAAGGTKRPTSVVMIVPGINKGKKRKGKDGEEVKPSRDDEKNDTDLKEAYDELLKAVEALPKMK